MSLVSKGGRRIQLTERARMFLSDVRKQTMDKLFIQLRQDADVLERVISLEGKPGQDLHEIPELCVAWMDKRDCFIQADGEYIETLTAEERDEYITQSFQPRMQKLDTFRRRIQPYLSQKNVDDLSVQPRDSVSQTGRISHVGKSSHVSTTSSVLRLKEEQKRAELLARQAALKKRHDIDLAKLRLQLEEEELNLQTELNISDARKAVIDNYDKSPNNSVIERDLANANVSAKCKPITKDVGFVENCNTNVKPISDVVEVCNTVVKGTNIDQNDMYVGKESQMSNESSEGRNKVCLSDYETVDEYVSGSGCENTRLKHSSPMQNDYMGGINNVQHMLRCLQLPRADLPKYDGDHLQYWSFMQQFCQAVEVVTTDNSARLIRLIGCLTGKARRAVECCMAMDPDTGYSRAKQILKDRFGNEHLITQAWISRLIQFPAVKDGESLQSFADELRNLSEVLTAMGCISEINTQTVLKQIVDKLPMYLQNRWRRRVYEIKQRGIPTIVHLVDFVFTAASEASDPVFGEMKRPKPSAKNVNISQRPNKSAGAGSSFSAASGNNSRPERECMLCSNRHGLLKCDTFKAMTPEKRWELCQGKGLCMLCLNSGHWANTCRSEFRCTVGGCGRRHSKFLHQPAKGSEAPTVVSQTKPRQNPYGSPLQPPSVEREKYLAQPAASCNSIGAGAWSVALPVIPVKVRAVGSQNYIETYALLDSGSTNTFCSKALYDKLGVVGLAESLTLTTLHGGKAIDTRVIGLEASDLDFNVRHEMPRVFALDKLPISHKNKGSETDLEKWPHLQGIAFPSIEECNVGLLVGQDNGSALIPREVRYGNNNEPYAVRTLLGWTLNGPVGNCMSTQVSSAFTCVQTEPELTRMVEQFWEMENIEHGESLSEADKGVLNLWSYNCQKTKDGHFQLPIPFNSKKPNLPDNKVMAEHRLQLLGNRLNKNPVLKKKYCEEIHKLITDRHAEIAPIESVEGRKWYLPHHPVVNAQKPDKLRIVFDCSAKFNGVSLNDIAFQGPYLTSSLFGTLTRFRQEVVAFIADITAMFYQVLVVEEDRDVMRFLWWPDDDTTKAPIEYRMRKHIFGGVWSPSCANYALRRTAEENLSNASEEAVSTVDRNFYVDDCLKSVPTVKEGMKLALELRELLGTGGFQLSKWMSTSRELLSVVPDQERAKTLKALDLNQEILPCERALGVYWNVETDHFTFRIVLKDKPHTRRGLLSVMSSVYDPIGLVNPFVLVAKLILQELCRRKLGWDEDIPSDMRVQWQRWLMGLNLIEKMNIPRCIKPGSFGDLVTVQLHHFSDASVRAYGSASYIRLVDTNGNINCAFLLGRSRLAPLKSQTIPRLELSAATLSAKSDQTLRQELDLSINQSIFWTDSTIVLRYLRNEIKRFHTFVSNRISMILEASDSSDWRHVPSGMNPADDASRGLSAEQLLQQSRWTSGPHFLWQTEDSWPRTLETDNLSDSDPEVKCSPQIFTATTITPIRTVRKILSSLLREQTLDDEGLLTLMCQVEAIVNGRPLTKLSDDPKDLEPLTPNHLLLLRQGVSLPPGLFQERDQYKRRWRHVQYLADIFWRRWVKEYLPELQKRQKWLTPSDNLSCGDLVLMVNNNAPRNVWPMAIVTDTYPGKDGLVRSVKVRTSSSTFVRPVNKLCLLERVNV